MKIEFHILVENDKLQWVRHTGNPGKEFLSPEDLVYLEEAVESVNRVSFSPSLTHYIGEIDLALYPFKRFAGYKITVYNKVGDSLQVLSNTEVRKLPSVGDKLTFKGGLGDEVTGEVLKVSLIKETVEVSGNDLYNYRLDLSGQQILCTWFRD